MRLDFVLELRCIGKRIAVHLFAHRIENLPRWLHTQISREERCLQILQDRRIDLPLAKKNRVDSLGERRLVLLTEFFSRSRSVGSGSFFPKSEIIRLRTRRLPQPEIVAEAPFAGRACGRSAGSSGMAPQ